MVKSLLEWMGNEKLVKLDDITREDSAGFEARLRIQKCVYMVQSLGLVDTNYDYNRYKHGPYSPALTQDYYKFAHGELKDDKLVFDKTACREIMTNPKTKQNHGADWLEIATTILLLNKDAESADSLVNHVARIKVMYSERYIQSVLDDMLKMRLAKILKVVSQ